MIKEHPVENRDGACHWKRDLEEKVHCLTEARVKWKVMYSNHAPLSRESEE